MRYRNFLHKGRPTDRVDSTEGSQFGVPDAVGIAEVAAALGVPEAEVTVGFSDLAPATAEVTIPPTAVPPVELSKLDALIEAVAGARDLGELKAAAAGIKAR